MAPLPFGSVELAWIVLWCCLLAVSLATADLSRIRSSQLPWLLPVPAAFLVVAAVAIVQGLPPNGLLEPHPAWKDAADLLGTSLEPRIVPTADPPWRSLGPTLLFTLAFTRAFLLATDRQGAGALMAVIAGTALAYAAYGIAAALIDPTSLLWRTKQAYEHSLTGTFVNRNTAATYFGSAATIWLLLFLRHVSRWIGQGSGLREIAAELAAYGVPRRLVMPALGSCICLGATLMTGSRAGTILTLLALALAGAVWAGRQAWRWGRLPTVLIALALAVGLLELWGGTVTSRLASRGVEDVNRLETYRAVLHTIREFPWFGIGLGQFETVFPSYRGGTSAVAGVWDKAHSVPLELAAELGLPAALAIVVTWATVLTGLVLGCLRRTRGRVFPIAGLSVGMLGSAHSLVDFSLQIPGYAVLFAVVTACGLAQAAAGSAQSLPSSSNRDRPAEQGGRHEMALSQES